MSIATALSLLALSLSASMREQGYVLMQAVTAMVLGGVLGWERESAGKWAGFRTHMLVCLASLLFVRLGQILMDDTAATRPGVVQADPSRAIEAIVAGISFLGAGTIFRDGTKNRSHGLTTAASLLITASIGIAVAIDCYIIAIGVTALSLLILRTLNKLEVRFASLAKPGGQMGVKGGS